MSHDHDHDHDHGHRHNAPESDIALRVKAIEQLLTEKGIVDPAAIDLVVDYYETRVGPRNGARVVAEQPDLDRQPFTAATDSVPDSAAAASPTPWPALPVTVSTVVAAVWLPSASATAITLKSRSTFSSVERSSVTLSGSALERAS